MGKNHASQYANFGSLPLFLLFKLSNNLFIKNHQLWNLDTSTNIHTFFFNQTIFLRFY